jgi:hypothetical protein
VFALDFGIRPWEWGFMKAVDTWLLMDVVDRRKESRER